MSLVPPPLVLASGSPRRAELLARHGLLFTIDVPNTDESALPGEDPGDQVLRLAREKAATVALRHPGAVVLGADTAVILHGRVYGKPADRAEGARMLGELQGRAHLVLTGYAVMAPGGRVEAGIAESQVALRPLDRHEIERYLDCGEYHDKAGSYAAQGEGRGLIERITGSYTNVVGLPMGPVLAILRGLGYHVGDAGPD